MLGRALAGEAVHELEFLLHTRMESSVAETMRAIIAAMMTVNRIRLYPSDMPTVNAEFAAAMRVGAFIRHHHVA